MGSTASRIETAAGGGCGGCAWRREVVVKGTEDGGGGGENRKINTVQVVEMGGNKNNEERKIDQRDDELIWSPGSPSFRDYLFLGSFDSNEDKSIQDGGARACEESTVDKPEEAVHHRKVNPWTIPAKSRVNIIKYGRMLDGRKYLHCTKNKP